MSYICLVTSAVFLAWAAAVLIKSRSDRIERVFLLMVGCGLTSYFPHFMAEHGLLNAVLCDIINILQIITLNSDAFESYQATLSGGWMFYGYIIIRAAVHIFTPVLFAFAAFSFIKRSVAELRMHLLFRRKKYFYAFSALNAKTVDLSRDIMEKDNEAAIIFFGIENISTEIYGRQARYVIAAPQSITLRAIPFDPDRQEIFYLCTDEDDEQNINTTLAVMKLYSGDEYAEHRRKLHIIVFSDSPEIDGAIMYSQAHDGIDLRLVDRCRLAADHLLMEHPLYSVLDRNSTSLEAMIIGSGEMAMDLMRDMIWSGQMMNIRFTVHVIVADRASSEGRLEQEYPELLSNYDIRFHECDVDDIAFKKLLDTECKNAEYIVVCRDSDEKSYRTAAWLRRYFYKSDGKFTRCPFIAFQIRSNERYEAICDAYASDKRFIPFGNDSSIFSYDELIDNSVERMAKNMHFAYTYARVEGGSKLSRDEILRRYHSSQFIKRSNFAAAMNIQYKLWQLGFEFTDDADNDDDLFTEFLLEHENDIIDELTRVEHDRWTAFHRAEGWSTVSAEEALTEGYSRLSSPRNKKSDILLMHPDICPFGELSEKCRKIGKKDTTGSDKELLMRLPEILSNKWGLSDRAYHVKKLDK